MMMERDVEAAKETKKVLDEIYHAAGCVSGFPFSFSSAYSSDDQETQDEEVENIEFFEGEEEEEEDEDEDEEGEEEQEIEDNCSSVRLEEEIGNEDGVDSSVQSSS